MANVLYENFILENKFKDILETKLDTIKFMTVDNSLTSEAGMIKRINTYTYEGTVEEVAKGATNTTRGKVTFAGNDHRVKVKQQVFDYHDEDVMQDPLVVEVGVKGGAVEMVNDMNNDFFTEIAKTTTLHSYAEAFNYDVVVDAIEKLNIEEEQGLFLIIGNDLKAQIRKDVDFKSSKLGEILYSGQIGDICGVPVVVSKKVPADTCYLATKEAVTCFIKKESEVEQKRQQEERINTVITRKVVLVALTDSTKAVKITKKA